MASKSSSRIRRALAESEDPPRTRDEGRQRDKEGEGDHERVWPRLGEPVDEKENRHQDGLADEAEPLEERRRRFTRTACC